MPSSSSSESSMTWTAAAGAVGGGPFGTTPPPAMTTAAADAAAVVIIFVTRKRTLIVYLGEARDSFPSITERGKRKVGHAARKRGAPPASENEKSDFFFRNLAGRHSCFFFPQRKKLVPAQRIGPLPRCWFLSNSHEVSQSHRTCLSQIENAGSTSGGQGTRRLFLPL